jgi:hypothetical protein
MAPAAPISTRSGTIRFGRGLFRLWLVLSVLWIGGVSVLTWPAFDPAKLAATKEHPYTGDFDPDAYLEGRPQPMRWSAADAALLTLTPPVFVLALGSALVWAFRGFR